MSVEILQIYICTDIISLDVDVFDTHSVGEMDLYCNVTKIYRPEQYQYLCRLVSASKYFHHRFQIPQSLVHPTYPP